MSLRVAAASLLTGALALGGCGDDEGSTDATATAAESTETAPSTETTPDPSSGSGTPTSTAASSSTDASTTSATTVADDTSSGTDTTGAVEDGWVMVWSDEFDGDSIDATHWAPEVNCWGGGNGEQQCYIDDPQTAFVADGVLHIVARNQQTSGPAVNDDDPAYDPDDTSATLPYRSARLRTRDMGDWRFGRIEVRARLPFGQGTWPAIWMLPSAQAYGGWAASGEIDIMEAVNLHVDGENRVHGTLHYGSYWPTNVYSGAEYVLPGGANPADEFHDYAVEWESGEIRWYVDGDHFATQRQDGWYTLYDDGSGELVVGEGAAPFDESFHLILNLAVGGAWAANVNQGGIDPTVFPQELLVDYVRVYECSVDPQTGDGCDTTDGDFELVPGNPAP